MRAGNLGVTFISLKGGYRSCCKNLKCACWDNKRSVLSAEMTKKNSEGVMTSALLKTHGVSSPFQSEAIKEKARKTNIERYGVENVFQSEAIKEKIKVTCLERYGVSHQMRNPEVKRKWKSTMEGRHGVTHPYQIPAVKEKARENILKKYGVSNFSRYHIASILPEISDQRWWDEVKSIHDVFARLNSHLSINTIYVYLRNYRPDLIGTGFIISDPHQRVIDLLKGRGIEYTVNDRKVIPPLELDIFIPSKNLAIEVNGVYWHSEISGGKDKIYHLNKTVECEKKNITLLQFWDIEVEHRWEVVSSMVLTRCGIHEKRIAARKCVIEAIPSKIEKDFLEKNHLQGYVPSSICYGLYHEGELVSLMSFGKPRFNDSEKWELLRFCNRINTRVVGGASKLFKMKPEGSIVSYSDRRYSSGKIYSILGLNAARTTKPGYRYTYDYRSLDSRIKYQKHKLSSLLESFDPSLTEWENMKANGYDRVWDCRQRGFRFALKSKTFKT